MSFIQVLMLLLILSANGIIIPNSAWYCLIAWLVVIFLKSITDAIKKYKEEEKKKLKELFDNNTKI